MGIDAWARRTPTDSQSLVSVNLCTAALEEENYWTKLVFETLSSFDFSNQLNKTQFSDVILVIKEVKFYCHKGKYFQI